jgi:hypothetical protein
MEMDKDENAVKKQHSGIVLSFSDLIGPKEILWWGNAPIDETYMLTPFWRKMPLPRCLDSLNFV